MTPSLEEALRLLRLAQRDLQTYRILAAHPDASLARHLLPCPAER